MQIKTTHTLTTDPTESTVTIKWLDNYEHSHDLEQSREIAPSGLAIQLACTEAEKAWGYSATQILNALHGIGTAEGSKCLEEAGGAHLKRYNIQLLRLAIQIVKTTNTNIKLGSTSLMQREIYLNPMNMYRLEINLSVKMLNWQSIFLLKRDGFMLST